MPVELRRLVPLCFDKLLERCPRRVRDEVARIDGFALRTVIFREEDHRVAIESLEERAEVGRSEMS